MKIYPWINVEQKFEKKIFPIKIYFCPEINFPKVSYIDKYIFFLFMPFGCCFHLCVPAVKNKFTVHDLKFKTFEKKKK